MASPSERTVAPSPATPSDSAAEAAARRLRPPLRLVAGPVPAARPGLRRPGGAYALFGKRALDLALTLAAAPFWGPLTLLLLLAVRLDPRSGRASPLFGQVRIGRGGRRFTCWKIRTMAPDAEAALARHLAASPEASTEWRRRQKLARDPRILPLGRLLRAASLDELPQLWNVLRGEMSLVGPRPFTPEQRRLYPTPETYQAMTPGLTGRWQVGPRGSGGDFAGRAVEDARYLARFGLGADLAILARTVGVVLGARGE
jgi:lipopolysaccharide/colanic/teichoic acid biosynthesis glycosyltransferase